MKYFILTNLLFSIVFSIPLHAQIKKNIKTGQKTAAQTEEIKSEKKTSEKETCIETGIPKYKLYSGLGLNYVSTSKEFGFIGFFRIKRTTNFSFYDLQIHSYYVPKIDSRNIQVQDDLLNRHHLFYALVRFKKSQKFFDWNWLYDWSIYQFKTSTIEKLNARAIMETGFGVFLLHLGSGKKQIRINWELGLVFDYANLDAYAQNVSTGQGKTAFETDWDFRPFFGKALIYYYYELVNPDPDNIANQSRIDVEANISRYFFTPFYTSLGVIYTKFILLNTDKFDQPKESMTFYLAATFKF